MKMLLILIKTQLKVAFGISALKYRFFKEKRKRWEPILIMAAVILGLGPLISFYAFLMYGVFVGGKALNHPEIVITVSFVFGQLIVLIFGVFYIMSAFYFSRDIYTLIPLPLKPYEILGSKFAVVMLNEYITLLPILLPAVVIFGLGTGQGIFYWVKGFFIIIASPVIPLILAAMFNIILMRIVNIRKSKDLLVVIGSLMGLVVGLSVNFFLQRLPDNNPEEFIKNLLDSRMGLINAIGRNFPPSIWATLGLSTQGTQGFGYFALFIGVSVLLFIIMLWVGNSIFYKGVLAGQEISRKRKAALPKAESDRRYGRFLSPVLAVFLRECRILFRTPVYVLNGLSGAIIGPFILLFTFISRSQNEEMMEISDVLRNPKYIVPVTLGGLGVMLFAAGINTVASTAVSREGRTFWITKLIPVLPREQILGKFLNAYLVSAIGIATTSIMLSVFVGFSMERVIIMAVMGLLGSISIVALNLAIDVLHPKLEWSNPQEAVKQNVNGLLGMIVALLIIGLFAAISVAMVVASLPEWLVYAALALASIILAVLGIAALFSATERQYKKLEI